jgi:hypothetical protein
MSSYGIRRNRRVIRDDDDDISPRLPERRSRMIRRQERSPDEEMTLVTKETTSPEREEKRDITSPEREEGRRFTTRDITSPTREKRRDVTSPTREERRRFTRRDVTSPTREKGQGFTRRSEEENPYATSSRQSFTRRLEEENPYATSSRQSFTIRPEEERFMSITRERNLPSDIKETIGHSNIYEYAYDIIRNLDRDYSLSAEQNEEIKDILLNALYRVDMIAQPKNKPAPSAFMLYANMNRRKVKKANIDYFETNRLLKKEWQEMPNREKEIYERLADEMRIYKMS